MLYFPYKLRYPKIERKIKNKLNTRPIQTWAVYTFVEGTSDRTTKSEGSNGEKSRPKFKYSTT